MVNERCSTCKDMLYKLINNKIRYKSHFDIVLFYYNPEIQEFRQFQKQLGLRAVPDIIVRKPYHLPKGLFKVYRKNRLDRFFRKFWMFRAKKIRRQNTMMAIAALRKQAERLKGMKMSRRDRREVNRIMARKLDKLVGGH